ncbi:hypothetical protein M378DRAFT_183981 [Amanita muscaria Koide BX008]|uniref:Mini-chromosome maintenance complex-binding protein n=1 Tax=Amanita muscaria (strain Koide BX008) TaxID=946122 RepID=A0A0C2T191_AMAMK|nr:hypothetical protein M378DRAFT_183981 [Amanita muscaria Koide BX008]
MVSSAALDALADPHRALIDLFDGELSSFPQKVATHFSKLFSTSLLDEIPVLDVARPPHRHENNSIVRFRAMVQDTSLAHEMYLAKRSDGSCGGWGISDLDDVSIDVIDYANLRERHVIWAVSIPGESRWCSSTTSEETGTTPLSSRPHKFPLPQTAHVGAQVKIYDVPPEAYKATDILEFFGILSSEPPTFAPTLHVLFSKVLPASLLPCHFPILDASYTNNLRHELISWIADEALAGDKGAAEWILLCAIARVQARHYAILPPPMTLSRFPSPYSSSFSIPTISYVLALIFPLLTTIPLSLPVLNNTSFYPQSNDEDLYSGWLQLPRGTICMIAEGEVGEGEINGKALLNIRAVQEALDSQTLQYIFPYSSFTFETDLNFIILSDGRKSTFFQTYLNVPFQPVVNNITMDELKKKLYKPHDAISMPSKEKLEEFRQLVCGAKVGTSSIEQHVAQRIQEDFIKERKSTIGCNLEPIGAIDLMHRIMLARLYALSLHQPEVDIVVWEKVKILDLDRKARIVHE